MFLAGCQLTLSLVMLIAAIGKLAYPPQFLTALRMSGIPGLLVPPVAILIIVFEGELAFALLFSTTWSLPLSFAGTFLLLGVFTGWLTWMDRRKRQVPCGCFGVGPVQVSKRSILRNCLFMGITAMGFLVAFATTSPLPSPSVWILALDGILAGGTPLLFFRHPIPWLSRSLMPHVASGRQAEAEETTRVLAKSPK